MDHTYPFYICVLKQYLAQIMGEHYPREIVTLIILASYEDIKISCGYYHSVILKNNKIYIQGLSSQYQMDVRFENIRSISCGCEYTVISLKMNSNKLYIWGNNEYGQIGVGNYDTQCSPQELLFCSDIKLVECGYHHTFVLLKSEECYCWGGNEYGQLGLGNFNRNQNTPQKLFLLPDIVSIKCGGHHTVALTKSNKCYVWGRNNCGQLGLGDKCDKCDHINFPQELNLSNIISVSGGAYHTIALTNNKNEIYVWGFNKYG